jgi:SEC-C motif-containing protein
MIEGMKPLLASAACPCGRQSQKKPLPFGQCCGRWLDTDTPAPDAECLMRSRYCAFVLERAPYLLKTWHASHRPASVEFDPGVKWLGLEVRSHTVQDATHAEVEFVARQKPTGGAAVRLHERSRFMLESGHWLYVDGDAL